MIFAIMIIGGLIWSAIAIVFMLALAKAASQEPPAPSEEMEREA